MKLLQLRAHCFRSIEVLEIDPSPHLNVIYGNNGSGKSSLLEMIYCLSRGRSFRTHLAMPMVQHGKAQCEIFGFLESTEGNTSIGYRKSSQGKTDIRMGEDLKTPNFKTLAELLPVQLFEPDSHNFLTGGPGLRRKFIDWGLFYTEPSFLEKWQRFQRILKQRNAALVQKHSDQAIHAWDLEFIQLGEFLSKTRAQYINSLLKQAEPQLSYLVGDQSVEFEYYSGWPNHQSLSEALKKNTEKDKRYGYTTVGPHRFDLVIQSKGALIENIFSRGEQKRLVLTLYLAQGSLLKATTNKQCLYLFDDILSELDAGYQARVLDTLLTLEDQVFLTSLTEEAAKPLLSSNRTSAFHMDQGALQ